MQGGLKMDTFRIYDNEEEKWVEGSFETFDDADQYVSDELGDVDCERYSIYERISGY